MKFIWEPADIVGGKRFYKPKALGAWIIGYSPSWPSETKHCPIALSDGLIAEVGMSKERIAEWLTVGGFVPEEWPANESEGNSHD